MDNDDARYRVICGRGQKATGFYWLNDALRHARWLAKQRYQAAFVYRRWSSLVTVCKPDGSEYEYDQHGRVSA